MYIAEKYWDNYIGGTDDSLTLVEYLADFLPDSMIRITATPEEHQLMNKTLLDFATAPLAYDLCEMVPEEDMLEMAAACEELRKELYE